MIKQMIIRIDKERAIIGYDIFPIRETLQENEYLIEHLNEDFLVNPYYYKYDNSILIKMSEEEYTALYPAIKRTLAIDEILGQAITQGELERMELAQRITVLELMGGTSDV